MSLLTRKTNLFPVIAAQLLDWNRESPSDEPVWWERPWLRHLRPDGPASVAVQPAEGVRAWHPAWVHGAGEDGVGPSVTVLPDGRVLARVLARDMHLQDQWPLIVVDPDTGRTEVIEDSCEDDRTGHPRFRVGDSVYVAEQVFDAEGISSRIALRTLEVDPWQASRGGEKLP